jgi:hypothetical protein
MKRIVMLSAVATAFAFAQVDPPRLASPAPTSDGAYATDNRGSAIYKIADGELRVVAEGRGSGRYFTLAPSSDALGFKSFDENGRQIPSLYDASTGEVVRLAEPAEFAGQPSFAADGTIAFTVGETLRVVGFGKESAHDLGARVNLAPISPDAGSVAFNDDNDQLFVLDLATGERAAITDDETGYFNPQWSPSGARLLYQRLNGETFVRDMTTASITALGETRSPRWATDEEIVFHRVESEGYRVVNADLYLARADGSAETRLTATSDRFEMEPTYDAKSGLYFIDAKSNALLRAPLDAADRALGEPETLYRAPDDFEPRRYERKSEDRGARAKDVPYVHQVYDTPPDAYEGYWACAPTTASMVFAYYNIVPPWPSHCADPSSHYNDYGAYVVNKYNFLGSSYTLAASNYRENDDYGGYGYMWNGGSPHSKMRQYYLNHGLDATQSESPPYSQAKAEIDADRLYTMCVGLTTSGHLVLAHTLGSGSRELIVNDPYGNKNTPYYPSYDGKNTNYDWPGYNNGNENLNTVYWCIKHSYAAPTFSDTLVDDMDFTRFLPYNQAPSSMELWRDSKSGHNGHMWFTSTKSQRKCYGLWRPTIPLDGMYRVFAYVATATAENVRYTIRAADGERHVFVDQSQYNNEWIDLGVSRFDAGSEGYLLLGDGSDKIDQYVVFDAARFSYEGPVSADDRSAAPTSFALEQNYPNPFNPTTTIRYETPRAATVRVEVFNALGEKVATLVDGRVEAGVHSVEFDADVLAASGAYFYRLAAVGDDGKRFRQARKMLLAK